MLQPDDYLSPTGKLIQFNTADCDKNALERSLKFYDRQLYLKWNPKKRSGWGMWEVRRRPNELTALYEGAVPGGELFRLEYSELDIVNHILDVPVLTYDVLGKIKSMDTWTSKNWVATQDYEARRAKDLEDRRAREELKYNIKQFKREWRELAIAVQQGMNPAEIWNLRKGQ